MILKIFSFVYLLFMPFFGWSVQIFYPFLKIGLSYWVAWVLYRFWIKSFIRYMICNYFLLVACLFHFLNNVFEEQKFNSDEVQFINVLSLTYVRNLYLSQSQGFSCRSFIIFNFTFKSVNYFELIFVWYEVSKFCVLFLHNDVQLFQNHLLNVSSLEFLSTFVQN